MIYTNSSLTKPGKRIIKIENITHHTKITVKLFESGSNACYEQMLNLKDS